MADPADNPAGAPTPNAAPSLAGMAEALRADLGAAGGSSGGGGSSGRRGLPPVPRAPGGSSLDLATIAGIGGALALMGVALALGGSVTAFVNLPAALIVLGGTVCITAASFSAADVGAALAGIAGAVVRRRPSPHDAAVQVLETAEYARAHGLLKLQGGALRAAEDAPVLHKGLSLAIDAVPEAETVALLRYEIASAQGRLTAAAAVLRRAAEVAPAMGLIGTLVGLVQMLGNLDHPAAIGPAMAVALLTTFYGALLANLVLVPLASKIERNAETDAVIDEVYLLGALAVGRKDNPRRLELQLNSVLPAGQRVSYFD